MDRDEALKVAQAIQYADGECIVCVRNICRDLNKLLPQFDWFELVAEVNDYWDADDLRADD